MKIVIGITGATGAIYGIRLLQLLQGQSGVETHLVISEMGKATIAMETAHSTSAVEKLATQVYSIRDLAAPISSGSFRTDGMIVAPCSVKTLSAIANSNCDNLLSRAADVCLKERRRVLALFRETPLHAGHCELMLRASQNGVIVMPPLPAFYLKPKTIEEMVDHTVARVLDFWGLDVPTKRWDS